MDKNAEIQIRELQNLLLIRNVLTSIVTDKNAAIAEKERIFIKYINELIEKQRGDQSFHRWLCNNSFVTEEQEKFLPLPNSCNNELYLKTILQTRIFNDTSTLHCIQLSKTNYHAGLEIYSSIKQSLEAVCEFFGIRLRVKGEVEKGYRILFQ
jgi:hypothetical protein